jgi:hypothetical protein
MARSAPPCRPNALTLRSDRDEMLRRYTFSLFRVAFWI